MKQLFIERPGNRQPLALGSQLGRGGEANVYAVADQPALAAKLWLEPDQVQRAKLLAMLRTVPQDPAGSGSHISLAWPQGTVVDAGGQVMGFVMPRLATGSYRALHQIYHPGSRRTAAPGLGWHWLLRVARNLSATLASLHAAGYVVGDLNESNVLVSDRALVTLIDLDSIQVRDGATVWRCPVGKLEYTAPELLGRSFREVDRRPGHDVFSLAVLSFQLLMEGSHPFSGVWQGDTEPPGLEDNIRARRSPWFGSRQLSVPPAAPPARVLGPRLRRLFSRSLLAPAFARPSARDWQRELDRFEQSLKTCRVNPLHTYSASLPTCPWCERRLKLGIDPFPAPAGLQSGK